MYPFDDLTVFKFSELVVRLDYDGTKITYKGIANKGSLPDTPTWKINRYSYNGNNQIILIESAIGSWDDRTSLNYN
jgi:hypothetical protein